MMKSMRAGSRSEDGEDAAPVGAAPPGSVQSVVRAFDVLQALAREDGETPLQAIAQQTGLTLPTAHRLLKTLMAGGYVRQGASRGYALGPSLIGLGDRATPPLAERCRPLLAELEETSRETANLAMRDGDHIAYVAQVPSRHRMRMFTEVGRRVLPHATAVGKAILATLPETTVRELLRRTGLPRYTEATITDEDAFLAEVRRSRRRGFAIDDSEQEVGVRCIAVVVPGAVPGAAVSISGPAARITDAVVPAIVASLTAAAQSLAAQMPAP